MRYPHTLGRALPGPLSDTHESHSDGYATVNCCCPHHPSPAAQLRPGIRPPLLTSLQHSRRAVPWGPLCGQRVLHSRWRPPDSLPNEADSSVQPWASRIYCAQLSRTFLKSSLQLEYTEISMTDVLEETLMCHTCMSTDMNSGLITMSAGQRTFNIQSNSFRFMTPVTNDDFKLYNR